MSRRPLAPDVWEQALINGRRMHSSDSAAALAWAEQWYAAQGCLFDGPAPAPAPLPELEPEPEAGLEVAAEPVKINKPRRRARQEGGRLKGDDPTTPDVNEAWAAGEST